MGLRVLDEEVEVDRANDQGECRPGGRGGVRFCGGKYGRGNVDQQRHRRLNVDQQRQRRLMLKQLLIELLLRDGGIYFLLGPRGSGEEGEPASGRTEGRERREMK